MQAVLEYAGPETLPLMADIAHELLGLLDDAADARGARPGGGRGRGDNQRAGRHEPPALLPCLRATHALVLAARLTLTRTLTLNLTLTPTRTLTLTLTLTLSLSLTPTLTLTLTLTLTR